MENFFKLRPLASLIMVPLLMAACSSHAPAPKLELQARVAVCINGGNRCFALPVPNANVQVLGENEKAIAHATTDDSGRASVALPGVVFKGRVTVQSPLFEGGEAGAPINSNGRGRTSVSLDKRLVAGAH